jgi:hypothetical protein
MMLPMMMVPTMMAPMMMKPMMMLLIITKKKGSCRSR